MNRPDINVTPLIDVLLVLLIIFMVVAPLRPTAFTARVPAERDNDNVGSDPQTLVVTVAADHSLALNRKKDLGTVDEPDQLISLLKEVFQKRAADQTTIATGGIERTVFIKAPRSIGYGSVARVIDSVKVAGASPISLQIDYLDQ